MVGAMPVNLIPKFSSGDMDSHNGIEGNDSQVFIGSRIKCGDHFGSVKFIGEVSGYKGIWYGVEWDEETRGKHDGCVDGIQYFKTSKPGAGSFVRPNKISPMKSCADAIRRYYGDREDETVAAHCKTVINEWKREMGAPFIEMVGFEKIHQKQKLDRLQEVCVHDQNVSTAGDVAALCPNVRHADVSANLLSGWREIINLSAQLPQLTELDVSKNRMAIDVPEQTLTQMSKHFRTLEKLNISYCSYEWHELLTLSQLWPNVIELISAYNSISTLSDPGMRLSNLGTLRLDGCPVSSWREVLKIGRLRVKVLSLNDCVIQQIRFGEEPAFADLEVLFLNRNRIHDWRSISELGKLKKLKKLYFLKNPIQNTEDYDTGAQMIIAHIGTLVELNGSTITPELRRGAEYDYMKRFGADWKASRDNIDTAKEFGLNHNRWQTLIDKYGLPDDSLLVKQSKMLTLTSQLLELTIIDENGKTFKKKFPSTMAVQKLVTLSHRLFAKLGHKGKPTLYLLDEIRDTEIPLDNNMKELSYFAVKNGDVIHVRFR